MKLSEIGEFGLIERITGGHRGDLPSGVVGAGDDAAVIPLSLLIDQPGGDLLVTTDLMVEGRHFRLASSDPYSLGWKLLAVNISDVAAMGGEPAYAVITLQLRQDTSFEWVEELYRGIYALAGRHQVAIIGGDTSSGSEISLGITLIGRSMGPAVLRSGAQVGDVVWVSGELGSARLGFELSEGSAAWEKDLSKENAQNIGQAFSQPSPRLDIARLISQERLATSLIDISDGLVQDVGHIAMQSRVAIELDLAAIPCLDIYPDKRHALVGGEDYQLLFTAPERVTSKILAWNNTERRGEGEPLLTAIGRVIAPQGESLVNIRNESNNASVSAAKYLDSIGLKGYCGFKHF